MRIGVRVRNSLLFLEDPDADGDLTIPSLSRSTSFVPKIGSTDKDRAAGGLDLCLSADSVPVIPLPKASPVPGCGAEGIRFREDKLGEGDTEGEV